MNFDQLVVLCHDTHQQLVATASRVIDTHLAARNFLFGHYIVHFEQEGADRASYGKQTLKALSQALKASAGRGFSVDNLELMRRFYLQFRSDILRAPISETLSRKSLPETPEKSETASRILPEAQWSALPSREMVGKLPHHFTLGWSHYVELLTLDDTAERRFYEIEAAANQWTVRELQRQIASSLYQRLALSRDKEEIRRLASEGQVVEKAADLIKNPLVLEFLGLEDRPHYSEDELESAIIDQLESFLLELGKGFLFEARQKRFTFDNDHFRVDPCPVRYQLRKPKSETSSYLTGSIFYNRLLSCYVLLDLKRDKLAHQDLGQMQIYPMRYEHALRLCPPKPNRRQLLRRLHKRSETSFRRTRNRPRAFYSKPIASRTRVLRGLSQSGRRHKTGEVSQDGLGQTIHQVAVGRLSHGIHPMRCNPLKPSSHRMRLSHGVNVNYFDRYVKLPDELPTIGILLCHRKNDALVELTLPPDANIFASKYQLYLPSKEELKARLEQITHDLEGEKS